NADVLEHVQYFDGLGRPIQQINIKQSPERNDLINHSDYDAFGRQTKQYLPYPATGNRGSYRTTNQPSAIQTYYKQNYPEDFTNTPTANTNPYSETLLENSPLNRTLKQAAPGADWKMGSGHEIQFSYTNNTTQEVRVFTVAFTANNTKQPTLSGGSLFYPAGTLTKTITKDENHDGSTTKLHTTEEFTNKQGQTLLKRTYAAIGSPSTVTAHDTYYVYDDFGNLTYVLPPKTTPANGISTSELNELCYQYKYDHRNRLIEKKIPGKGVEYIIYNKLDQPVMTQDALLRANNQWLVTKYDPFGRVAYTTIHTQTSNAIVSRETMQGYADNNPYPSQYETRSSNALPQNGTALYYTNNSIPQGGNEIHTINYYDSYANFDKAGFTLPAAAVTNVQGLATASKVRVLGTPSTGSGQAHWITTLMGYDTKGRLIWSGTY
ncbi:DUF6443 domain-containing protein, partial [Ascidiimonas sp. W6]|uniref:DUF6443 domain-containing protein n=1 Tax=Ascidiimonas meishanensis TaxID=3128903 RepID=UPI0030ED70AB